MRRITWRTSASAAAVTVQVFKTAISLESGGASRNPFAINCCLIAAPSAWLALHPKLMRWNVLMNTLCYANLGVFASLAGMFRENEDGGFEFGWRLFGRECGD